MKTERSLFGPGRGRALIGAVADSGQVARLAGAAGVDFLLVLSAGVYRNMGVSALAAYMPYANSNDLTESTLRDQILPAGLETPIVAGLMAADPTRSTADRLDRLEQWGVAGVVNYPSVTLVDGAMQAVFEEEGVTVDLEIAMLEEAKRRGMLAVGFVGADSGAAGRFAEGGLDALILTPGTTRRLDDIRERRDRLQHAIRDLNAALDRVRSVAPGLPCLVFGGPITQPEDLEQVYRQAPFEGFVGGSVFGRYPIEGAVTAAIRRFQGVAARPGGDGESGLGPMIGDTPSMHALFRLIRRAAACDLNVCIEGESGVGKELAAAHIHRLSRRKDAVMVTINCGAIPDTLLESELFGHERGSFTGADRRRLGKFELAHGGTLFLDEVGDLSPHGQVALLRAIQQREITRVGGNAPVPVDVRILSASNQPLARLVDEGAFRADLYYRLNNLTLEVPPLRDRLDDIPLLVEPILKALGPPMGRDLIGLDPSFLDKMRRHAWPGNLRELQHVLAQAALLEEGERLVGAHFVPTAVVPSLGSGSLAAQVESARLEARRLDVRRAMLQAGGNKSRAAAILRVSRKTLYAWLDEIDR